MGKIRSAWEIALERTEGLQIDKDRIREKADIDSARKAAGQFLSDDDGIDEGKLREELSRLNAKASAKALMMTATANISLPLTEEEIDDKRLGKVKTLVSIAAGGNPNAAALMEELEAFIRQYPKHRKDLMEKMKAQYKPVLEEKSAKLSRQYGTEVHLSYENDKEFMEAARSNLERLENQYEATLTNAKKQLGDLVEG